MYFPFQEHHLQRAISAQQVFREKRENMVIPVPEAESNVSYYDRLYRGEFKVPKQLIHIQRKLATIWLFSRWKQSHQFVALEQFTDNSNMWEAFFFPVITFHYNV